MRVKEINGALAKVESGRLTRTVNIQMLGNVKRGEYVIVHAGFAIEKVDPEKAKEALNLIKDIR
jgi:hydrogenase expression/formation protein HypC